MVSSILLLLHVQTGRTKGSAKEESGVILLTLDCLCPTPVVLLADRRTIQPKTLLLQGERKTLNGRIAGMITAGAKQWQWRQNGKGRARKAFGKEMEKT